VGDSVGYWIGDGMTKQSSTLKVNVANRAVFGCPLIRDAFHQRDGSNALTISTGCAQWPANWADDVNRFRPDVVMMMFGGPPPVQRDIPGGWAGPCDASFIQWYSKNVSDAIDILSAKGAMVFVAPSAYSRFPFMDFTKLDPLTDCQNKTYDDVVKTKPRARILPIDSFVCPTRETCADQMDGITLRDDGVHYTGDAALFMARWVTGQMLQ
jgi:hypothetical protein